MKDFVDKKRKELVKQKQRPTREKIIEFVHQFFDQLRKVNSLINTSCTLQLHAFRFFFEIFRRIEFFNILEVI